MLPKLVNFLALQANWHLCVHGLARGFPWLGPATVALSVALHVLLQPRRLRQLAFIGLMTVYGLFFDALLVALGLISFRQSPDSLWSPPAMLALWPNLATVFPLCLRWLKGHYVLAALLGFAGGISAYYWGARFGAASFPGPVPSSLFFIGLLWAATTPALLYLHHRFFSLTPTRGDNS